MEQVRKEMENLKFSFLCISNNDFLINYYAGINKQAFLITELCLEVEFKYFYGWKPSDLCLIDQILMTDEVEVKFGLHWFVRFSTSKHTVGNVVLTFTHVLHEILFENGMKDVPSPATKV